MIFCEILSDVYQPIGAFENGKGKKIFDKGQLLTATEAKELPVWHFESYRLIDIPIENTYIAKGKRFKKF